MKGERLVGGLRCGEVLALLPDHLSGSIKPADRAMLEAHVGSCAVCERFGGQYGAALRGLRASLSGPAGEAEDAALERLEQSLLRLSD